MQARISSPGGHSSMPPIDGSSVGEIMGRLLSRIAASPPAPRLSAPVHGMLRGLVPYVPGEAPGMELAAQEAAHRESRLAPSLLL